MPWAALISNADRVGICGNFPEGSDPVGGISAVIDQHDQYSSNDIIGVLARLRYSFTSGSINWIKLRAWGLRNFPFRMTTP